VLRQIVIGATPPPFQPGIGGAAHQVLFFGKIPRSVFGKVGFLGKAGLWAGCCGDGIYAKLQTAPRSPDNLVVSGLLPWVKM
jgi:hypothetical protein